MVVTEDTSQLERSALIPVPLKSFFMVVTFDVSKHLITSLYTELTDNSSSALLSFKTTLLEQGDWVIWRVGVLSIFLTFTTSVLEIFLISLLWKDVKFASPQISPSKNRT